MNCSEVQRVLMDYVEGGLSVREHRNVDLHMTTCSACAAEAQRWREAVSLLRLAPKHRPSDDLLDRVLSDAWESMGMDEAVQTRKRISGVPRTISTPDDVEGAISAPKRHYHRAGFSLFDEKNRHVVASLVASLLLFILCELFLSSPAGAFPAIEASHMEIQDEVVNGVFDFPRWWAEKSTSLWESWTRFFREASQ